MLFTEPALPALLGLALSCSALLCTAARYGEQQVPEGDDRTISNLLLDQIEFADVILLNKIDLLDPSAAAAAASSAKKSSTTAAVNSKANKAAAGSGAGSKQLVAQLQEMLHQLNPQARVIPTSRCDVDLQEVLLTGRFNLEQVRRPQ